MTSRNPSGVLATAEVLRSLPEAEWASLTSAGEEMRYQAGEQFLRVGAPTTALYVVVTGIVGVFVNYRNEHLVPCEVLGPGRLVGLSAFFPREPAILTAIAVMASTLLMIQARRVQALLLSRPEVALGIYEDLAYVVQQRRANLIKALAGEEVSFANEEICPSDRPTRFLVAKNTETGEIRGMCQRRFKCTVADGKGCSMAGKSPLQFRTLWPAQKANGHRVVSPGQ